MLAYIITPSRINYAGHLICSSHRREPVKSLWESRLRAPCAWFFADYECARPCRAAAAANAVFGDTRSSLCLSSVSGFAMCKLFVMGALCAFTFHARDSALQMVAIRA